MPTTKELGCESCLNYGKTFHCEHPNGCGIKTVTSTTIMCVHHPEYVKYMNFVSPMIPDQLFLFKVNQ